MVGVAFKSLISALVLYLTLPVTVASAERSFSKLKLIKSHLRSTMQQDRLSGLALMSIERERTKNIDIDAVVDKFVSEKKRRKF
jgi:hAT family C-terminal dimerisation region